MVAIFFNEIILFIFVTNLRLPKKFRGRIVITFILYSKTMCYYLSYDYFATVSDKIVVT